MVDLTVDVSNGRSETSVLCTCFHRGWMPVCAYTHLHMCMLVCAQTRVPGVYSVRSPRPVENALAPTCWNRITETLGEH